MWWVGIVRGAVGERDHGTAGGRFESKGEFVLRRLGQHVLRGADDDGEHERRRAERGDQREERLVEEDEAEEDAWRTECDGMEWAP